MVGTQRGSAVGGFPDHGDLGVAGEQLHHPSARQRLVVHYQDPEERRHAVASVGAEGWVRKVRLICAMAPPPSAS